LECKWHSGQEADLVCLKCGQPYCRECVKETREAHYCPDCHRASVERLAMQMGGKAPKVKEPKPVKVKEPKVAKEKPVKEPRESKKLRKPADKPMGPTLDDLAAAPPTPVEPPAPSLTPQERAAFWSEDSKHETVEPFTPVQRPAAPAQPRPQAPPAQPKAPASAGPVRVEGMPPPIVDPSKKVTAPPAAPPLVSPDAPPPTKRPVPTKEAREAAVMAAEGFPTIDTVDKGGRYRGAKAANEVMATTVEAPPSEEALVPESRLARRRTKRRERRTMNLPVAMQVPEDYDGEVTTKPSYIKAILFGMLAGLITSAAFASLAWWVHKDLGIFGWVTGLCIGVAVAYGSGWHFNWKLGLAAALMAMFWVSVERVAYTMLATRYNGLLTLPMRFLDLLRDALTTYGQSFTSIWLLFFLISGAVAFLVAFRPPPIKMQLASTAPRQPARHGS
jgi:hypothetical protein